MASRLDQALDEVIKDRRSERSGGERRNNNRGNRNGGDFTRRRQVDSDNVIRKRLGPSDTIKSFVRTVNVQSDSRGSRNVNSTWAHDMFDDEIPPIISRLGGRGSSNGSNRGSIINVENLHYNVTEKDLEELFSTVADVVSAKLVFDLSGRSTGVATIKYSSLDDAEKAVKKYNNVELDGQAMRIEIKEFTSRPPRVSGGRFNNNRLDSRRNDRGNRNDRGRNDRARDSRDSRNNDRGGRDSRDNDRGGRSRNNNKRDDRSKQTKTAEDLDREMDSYMKSTANNEDTDMILD
ncbi:uncharacterized protein EV154DRAFT_560608 [Mucor mucedo]|uniref:uncharacterized protein n=1 Tax=Mucor mucedo TaxID=29922 RepID=UPI00222000AE|nr:uncharacterized protein EV154DRAFT_560608 [Mucor mucedo]KAI7894110.1 hypothetical protein EV154DRAFT_560608 [Mucor mucedo]